MVFYEHPHFKISRLFLLLVGQWPYDEGNAKHFSRAMICLLSMLMGLTEIYEVNSWNCKFEKIIRTLPFFTFVIIIYLKYLTSWMKIGVIRDILERIKFDWDDLQTENEIEIMKSHTADGWTLGKTYVLIAFTTVVGFVLLLFTPTILDIIRPSNESRAQDLLSQSGYLTNAHGYSFYVILHIQCTAIMGILAITASDLLYIMIITHGCGLYSIAGYRLEHIFDDIQFISGNRKESVFRKRIINVVTFHLRLMKNAHLIMSCYTASFAAQFYVTIIAIASLLVNMYNSLVDGNKVLMFAFGLDVIGHYFTILINITPAQRVLNYSSELFYKIYSGNWYEAPVKTQKLLLILMKKAQKPFVASVPGISEMTYKTWATIVQTSLSYFTVITSIRE